MKKYRCFKCKRRRLAKFFANRNKDKGTKAPYCKDCQSLYYKKYYRKYRQQHIERAARANKVVKERNTALVNQIKNVPCKDCGKRYKPWQMDFDHLPGQVKIANISRLIIVGATNKLKTELLKCEVVCSNCHRDRTYRRRNGST